MMVSFMLAGLTYLLTLVYFAAACTDTVYVGTSDGHAAKSKDGGETWSTVLSNGGEINSISADGDNVYAGTTYGLYISHDGGATWSFKNLQTNSKCDPEVYSVFVDEAKSVYALIGTNNGCGRIAVSSDKGETWPINFALPNPPFSYKVENIYVDGPWIYVAMSTGQSPPTNRGGLGYTDDMGAHWIFKDQSSGLGSNAVECTIGRGQTIYAGLNQYDAPVSISKDGGVTWKTANTASTGLGDRVFAMYLQDDTLYVATYGGGVSWSNDFTYWTRKTTADGLGSNYAYAITGSGNNLYLATNGGLSISRDKGQTWFTQTTKNGLPSDNILSVFAQCV